jgi:hypothetical protein
MHGKSFYLGLTMSLTIITASVLVAQEQNSTPSPSEQRAITVDFIEAERSDGEKSLVIFNGKELTVYTAKENVVSAECVETTMITEVPCDHLAVRTNRGLDFQVWGCSGARTPAEADSDHVQRRTGATATYGKLTADYCNRILD